LFFWRLRRWQQAASVAPETIEFKAEALNAFNMF
jgi:hypothetical protein